MSSRKMTEASPSNRNYGSITSTSQPIEANSAEFSPTEFMSLSEDIGRNIQLVHSSSKKLKKLLKVIESGRGRGNTREEAQSVQTHTNERIQQTSKDIQKLNAALRRGDRPQKLQLEKLTNDFKEVVRLYSAVQQDIVAALRKALASEPLHDEEVRGHGADRQQQQLSIEADMQHELAMQEERQQQILEIETNIVDVNTIMCTIASHVHAQGQQVTTIESSVESATNEIEQAREELHNSQRQSGRRHIWILLIIVVIICLIVTGYIVDKLITNAVKNKTH